MGRPSPAASPLLFAPPRSSRFALAFITASVAPPRFSLRFPLAPLVRFTPSLPRPPSPPSTHLALACTSNGSFDTHHALALTLTRTHTHSRPSPSLVFPLLSSTFPPFHSAFFASPFCSRTQRRFFHSRVLRPCLLSAALSCHFPPSLTLFPPLLCIPFRCLAFSSSLFAALGTAAAACGCPVPFFSVASLSACFAFCSLCSRERFTIHTSSERYQHGFNSCASVVCESRRRRRGDGSGKAESVASTGGAEPQRIRASAARARWEVGGASRAASSLIAAARTVCIPRSTVWPSHRARREWSSCTQREREKTERQSEL